MLICILSQREKYSAARAESWKDSGGRGGLSGEDRGEVACHLGVCGASSTCHASDCKVSVKVKRNTAISENVLHLRS